MEVVSLDPPEERFAVPPRCHVLGWSWKPQTPCMLAPEEGTAVSRDRERAERTA